ncbi:MAG TPA: hypothetical protein VFV73_12385 [Streptosporangiaceae bacterium]|nr:hypothetical protein [Streptosporangiaceae bacterium]
MFTPAGCRARADGRNWLSGQQRPAAACRGQENSETQASSDVAGPARRLKRFCHPAAGPLTLHSTSLLVADDPTTRIVVLHPATPSDAAALERLGR